MDPLGSVSYRRIRQSNKKSLEIQIKNDQYYNDIIFLNTRRIITKTIIILVLDFLWEKKKN